MKERITLAMAGLRVMRMRMNLADLEDPETKLLAMHKDELRDIYVRLGRLIESWEKDKAA